VTLKVAPCSHEAAKYAVLNWHYSEAMPAGKLAKYGVWEDNAFIGAVIYGKGAAPRLGKSLGLDAVQVCELVRVALHKHDAPVSQIVAKSIRLLKADNPDLRIIYSFADPLQNHVGSVYQAGNWIYTGEAGTDKYQRHPKTGHMIHPRTWRSFTAKEAAIKLQGYELFRPPGKHRYLYPLDKQMRRRIESLRLPYPHAVEGSEESRIASGDEGQVRSLPTALG
jgi:hypothetical protein